MCGRLEGRKRTDAPLTISDFMNGSGFVLVGMSLGAAKDVYVAWLQVQNIKKRSSTERSSCAMRHLVALYRFAALGAFSGTEVRV